MDTGSVDITAFSVGMERFSADKLSLHGLGVRGVLLTKKKGPKDAGLSYATEAMNEFISRS